MKPSVDAALSDLAIRDRDSETLRSAYDVSVELESTQPSDADDGDRFVLRRALARFLVLSLLALVAVGLGTVAWAGHIAKGEALRDARSVGRGIADRIAAPLMTPALRAGDPAAQARLDWAMRGRMSDGSLYRVKIWSADARILYSDQTELLNQRFPLEARERSLLGTRDTLAAISDLQRDENVFERAKGSLVEVYAGFTGADGSPLLFEAYLSTDKLSANASVLHGQLLPLTLGSLALLAVLLLPLAVSLARRVERAQRERSRMLRTSIAATDAERRRIAQDLHDGVIQDLAGLGYTLSAIAAAIPPDPAFERVRASAEGAATIVREDVDALRGTLTEMYPPDLGGSRLVPVVAALLETAAGEGLRTRLDAPADLHLPLEVAVLVHRVVREGLRNVRKHANATSVTVRLASVGGAVAVEVVDDGFGMRPEPSPGHLGLRLLADTVADAGGALRVISAPGAGVRLTATVPMP